MEREPQPEQAQLEGGEYQLTPEELALPWEEISARVLKLQDPKQEAAYLKRLKYLRQQEILNEPHYNTTP